MVKKLKYLLFLIPFLFITNVNAWTLSQPYVNYEFANAPFPSGDYATEQTHYNTVFYVSPFLLGGVDYSDYVKSVYFSWYNSGFCAGQDISITGTLYGGGYGTTNALFNDESVTTVVKNNGTALSCVFNNQNGQLMNFQCYGKGGGDFNVEFHLNSYHSPNRYLVGVSKEVAITCDASNLDVISNATANTNAIISNQNGNTQVIINNQNSNTQNIIDNQNQNAQDIIDNQNQNTQDIIDSNKENFQTCRDSYNLFDKDNANIINNSYISSKISSQIGAKILYIPCKSNTTYTVSKIVSARFVVATTHFLPNINTTVYNRIQDNSASHLTITTDSLSEYLVVFYYYSTYDTLTEQEILDSIMISEGNEVKSYEPYGEEICINKIDQTNENINNLNDNITSENPPNTSTELDNLDSSLASDTPISDLITLPITLANVFINGIESSCSPVNLGSLYGTDLILPCINLEQRLGTDLWSKIDILFSLFMCYNIGMLFITAFSGITSLRDDFDSLYQPKHADTGYQPKHGG